MGIYKNKSGLTYSGSGVLIVEDYYHKNGRIIPCVILVRNKATHLYGDFGGTYEKKHKTLKITAYTELREESRNLLNISPEFMNIYVDVPTPSKHFYRIYMLKINGINRKYFKLNVKKIDNLQYNMGKKVPKYWRETDDIVHVPIQNIDFPLLGKRGVVKVYDISNKKITLSRRIKKVLYYSQTQIYNTLKLKPVAKKNNMTKYISNDYTNDTYSFIVK